MSEAVARISADWGVREYGGRLSNSGQGELQTQDLNRALERYVPGALKEVEFPQVTVGHIGDGCVTFTIHYSGGRANLFGLDFGDLMAGSPSYSDLYAALSQVTLPPEKRRPVELEVPLTPRSAPPSQLAMTTAALLLADHKICVVGAEAVILTERLRFIDDVASCLPFGLRSRLTVATWVKPSYKAHHFRLFFSTVPPNESELQLPWSARSRPALEPALEPTPSQDYLDWLSAGIYRRLEQLADAKTPIGFSSSEVKLLLEQLGVTAPTAELAEKAGVPADAGAAMVLAECAYWLKREVGADQLQRLLPKLRNYLDRTPSEADLERYRTIIGQEGLLSDQLPIDPELRTEFYTIVIRLAYRGPLNYQTYCQIEAAAGFGAPNAAMPHAELAEAIRLIGTKDRAVELLVLWMIRPDRARESLRDKQDHPQVLVDLATRQRARTTHQRLLFRIAIEYLIASSNARLAKKALSQHGYLAATLAALYPSQPDRQIEALRRLLTAVFGSDLATGEAAEILFSGPPTSALVQVVKELLIPDSDPLEALLLLSYGLASTQDVDPAKRRQYDALLKSIDRVLSDGSQGRASRRVRH